MSRLLPEVPFSREQAVVITTAYRNVFIDDDQELISVGLSATQRLTPEGSPVTVFSDNKPH